MIQKIVRLLALCFCCTLSIASIAQAPVVDDSENFAMLDSQEAASREPLAKTPSDYADTDDEIALARDNDIANREEADLTNKMRGLQQEIQELRGQLEIQAHDLKLLQQQQLSFYKDIDTRLRGTPAAKADPKANPGTALTIDSSSASPAATEQAIHQSTAQAVTAPIIVPTTRGNPADEQISYLAAYDLVKNKHYDEALIAMQNFTLKYPKGGYTANAEYWLGELYMVRKDYAQAITHFETVLKQFSTSSKAAACSLKIGYALASSGKKEEAKSRLQQVIKNYPDTPTAQLAAAKLRTLYAL